MRFQFYMMTPADNGYAGITPIGQIFEREINNTMGTLLQDAVAEFDVVFQQLVAQRQSGDGQIVLWCSIGEPPGSIVAVEVISQFAGRRVLQWTWHDGSIRI